MELVFEFKNKKCFFDLVHFLMGFMVDYEIWKNERQKTKKISASEISELIKKEPSCIFIKARNITLIGRVFKNPLIRVLKYSENYDIEITFDDEYSDDPTFQDDLFKFSDSILKSFNAHSASYGEEPADDPLTRVFFIENREQIHNR